MGEEARSDLASTRTGLTADVSPNTTRTTIRGITSKAWIYLCLFVALIPEVLSAGFFYNKIHDTPNTDGGLSNSESISEVSYTKTGFANSTTQQVKYLSTAQGGRVNHRGFQKSSAGAFASTSYIVWVEDSCLRSLILTQWELNCGSP